MKKARVGKDLALAVKQEKGHVVDEMDEEGEEDHGDESFEDELIQELASADAKGKARVQPEQRRTKVSCVIDLTQDDDEADAATEGEDSVEDESQDEDEEDEYDDVALNFRPLSELGDKFFINRQKADRARDRDKEYQDMVDVSLDQLENGPFRQQLHHFLIDVWQGSGSTNGGRRGRDSETVRASYIHRVEAKPAQCVDVRRGLPNGHRLCPEVVHALEQQRKTSLYSHQFQVLDRLFTPLKPAPVPTSTTLATTTTTHATTTMTERRCGRDVIITTPTSSGKSLCFNLGVFEKILRAKRQRRQVSGLYLFPLNALAKDQEKKLLEFNQQLPAAQRLRVVIMTGEHQTSEKLQLFRHNPPDILVTNPETLHYQLYRGRKDQGLWQHWRTFLSRLGICVLDEAHTYSGIFGCNASNLIRRLYVAVDGFGGDSTQIQFILASATIGNPVDLASRLLHRSPTQGDEDTIAWVQESGAQRPERAIITLESHTRSKVAAAAIIESWINLKWRSLVYGLPLSAEPPLMFCNTIDSVNKLRFFIQEKKRHISGKVRTYYSSMTPDAKAQVMRDLESGKVLCIICSNALEAGLDLPGLDACLMLSHPGSKMSFWQRVGRAGRSKPVLLSEEVEKIAFNSDYPSILRKHLSCCAHESDLWWNEARLVEKTVRELLEAKEVTLRSSQTRKGQLVQGIAPPWTAHRVVNMRGSLMEQVKVLWKDRGNVTLETLGKEQALWRAYPGAIFYSPDKSGKVQRFDVVSLELDPKNVDSHALLTLSTRKYCDTKAAITGKVEIKESWGEKIYQLEMGILTIEYGTRQAVSTYSFLVPL
ncbi:DEAD/DEAH box helicase domain containing protein [Acanthamoeba castellanii str. Neff]|uniref:DEAD/DEAH box helicase domain containing protein n=1 Tax=Acanthamoeba castellanii (strain ATCC 30010 / Neff) TaxID=1257118 RepID=L8GIV1_ACACF|nr:DEAD/DEAH box helicase domain containing protein [Acanthamoeba castellanii str. Neff]ELR12784.1 DEAD/DEAH box helicase domain containing protein [Acanthamoeba castellanii str. Neff]